MLRKLITLWKVWQEIEIESQADSVLVSFRSLQVMIGKEDIVIQGQRDLRIKSQYIILNSNDEFNPREQSPEQVAQERESSEEEFKRELELALSGED